VAKWRTVVAKVLIVEDSKIMNMGMQKDVRAIGYDATGVFNGLEAVKKVRKESFDLILMDIEMPVMDGFESIKEIRKITEDSFIPIIIVSSLEETESFDKGWLEAGADEFLHKPFAPSALQARVRACCGSRKSIMNSGKPRKASRTIIKKSKNY